jgi:hypothetical protein
MKFQEEFLKELTSGNGHDVLLKLVERHEAAGLSPRDAYDLLQTIWLDFGFDKAEEDTPLRDNLEYVMERVWYGSPARSGERE